MATYWLFFTDEVGGSFYFCNGLPLQGFLMENEMEDCQMCDFNVGDIVKVKGGGDWICSLAM